MTISRSGCRLLSVATLVALACAQPLQAQDADLAAEIERVVNEYHDAGQFNGSVLVAKNGAVVYEAGIGYAVFEWEIANAPDTKHRIGSVTKHFTSALILQLVEEGKIRLDAPITEYMPEYPKPQGELVTIHHLLNHTSGIPSYTDLPGFIQNESRNPYEPDSLVAVVSGMELEFEPGTQWSYNNSGYFILGAIIERVTDQTFDEVLDERLLAPLGLEDTGYDHEPEIRERGAFGYRQTLDGYVNAPYLDTSVPYAAGMMYSTVRDLYAWDQLLYTDAPFREAETKQMWYEPGMRDYAYGWIVHEVEVASGGPTVRVIEHGGGIFGWSTGFRRFPDDRSTIILIDNTSGDVAPLQADLTRVLHGLEPEGPSIGIGAVVADRIEAEGVEAGIAEYRRIKAEEPDGYDFSEQQLNRLGYMYLGRGDAKTAVVIFELNVEMFPDAFNTYDSLGEGYMEDGRTQLAIQNYERSLELNPGNQNAHVMLAKMGAEATEADVLELSAEILDRYVGRYELQPGFVLEISREGDRMFTQATGQPKAEIFAQSETRFYLKVVQAQIEFHVRGGVAESLTLFQGGQEVPAPRIE